MRLKKSQHKHTDEQRQSLRFPVECELLYKSLTSTPEQIIGLGQTLNISSGGVLFTTEEALKVGEDMELSINWPTKLDGKQPLKFVVVGRVVRNGGGTAALQIQRYEFRIRGKNPQWARNRMTTGASRISKGVLKAS